MRSTHSAFHRSEPINSVSPPSSSDSPRGLAIRQYGALLAGPRSKFFLVGGQKASIHPLQNTTLTRAKKIIGWKETVDLPDWGIQSIIAKADTGARRSAIDVKKLQLLPDGTIEFDIVLSRLDRNFTHRVRCPVAHVTKVRSSNGEEHRRYFVETRLRIGEREKQIELSLVCRKAMVCRMLLGRSALGADFIVDPEKKHTTRKRMKVRLRPSKNKHPTLSNRSKNDGQ